MKRGHVVERTRPKKAMKKNVRHTSENQTKLE